MTRARYFVGIVTLAAAWLVPGRAGAQVADRLGAGATLELYHFSDADAIGIRRILLITTPVAVRLPVTPRLTLALNGAWARGALERPDGSEATIAGPTDTELRATYVLGNDRVTLSAVALLPTGHEQLDDDEALVAGVIAADVLPFRITNWGTGGGIGASIAFAMPIGASAAGLSAGYVIAREFEPSADNSALLYRPGNQLHVTAALDHSFEGAGKFSLALSYLTFAADQSDGRNLYQSGDRVQGTVSYSFAAGARSSAIVYGGALHRGEGEYEVSSQINPAQDLFFAGIGGRVPFGRGVLQPGLDLRLSTSDDSEKGYTAGAGLAGEFPLSGTTLAPTLRVRYGSAEPGAGSKSTYVGTEVGLGIRFGGR